MNVFGSSGFPKTTAKPLTTSGAVSAKPQGFGFGSSGVSRRVIASAMSDRETKRDDSLCKLRLEITVHNLPNMPQGAKRSFLDFLYLDEQYDVVYLQDAIRNKLLSVECEGVDFEIITPTGFVVDESYFQDILQKALSRGKTQQQQQASAGGVATLGGFSSGSSHHGPHSSSVEPETWQFDVFIKQKKLTMDALSLVSGALSAAAGFSSGDLQNFDGGYGSAGMKKQQPATHLAALSAGFHQPAAVVAAPATGHLANALNAVLSDRSHFQLVPIAALNATLPRGKWRLEARVKTVKKKSDTIAECELVDLYVSHQIVSLVTFRRECIDRLVNLKPNACVQLWNVQCSAKTARDQQFTTNSHPMKLLFDEGSEVTLIDDPIIVSHAEGAPIQAIGMRSIRPHPSAASGALPVALYAASSTTGVVNPSSSRPFVHPAASSVTVGSHLQQDVDTASTVTSFANTVRTGVTSLATTLNSTIGGASTLSGGSSAYGVPPTTIKRTLLFPKPSPSSSTVLAQPSTPAPLPMPTPPPQSTAASASVVVDARDDYLSLKTAVDEAAADRMKKRLRQEVTDKCFICDMNLEDDADLALLFSRLQKFNRKLPLPTPAEVKELMTDRRDKIPEIEEGRIYCKTTFVNTLTKRLHRVHCRCAHVCTEYQRGDDLRSIVAMAFTNDCSLCGENGACMRCTNPECDEWYHTTCAIFSNGYVNFDIRDPYLPRPACPRHTNPNPNSNRAIRLSWVPSSGSEAFDSACVDRYDLRDPDDE